MKAETEKRLRDAWRFAIELEGFLQGKTRDDFLADRGLQLIAQKLLEFVGEAMGATNVNEAEITDRYVSLREHLLHEYDLVDHASIWAITQSEIPALIASLDSLLGDAPSPAPNGSPIH